MTEKAKLVKMGFAFFMCAVHDYPYFHRLFAG